MEHITQNIGIKYTGLSTLVLVEVLLLKNVVYNLIFLLGSLQGCKDSCIELSLHKHV